MEETSLRSGIWDPSGAREDQKIMIVISRRVACILQGHSCFYIFRATKHKGKQPLPLEMLTNATETPWGYDKQFRLIGPPAVTHKKLSGWWLLCAHRTLGIISRKAKSTMVLPDLAPPKMHATGSLVSTCFLVT